jgi:flagellar basal body P-ring formation protein FlgA
VNIRTETARSVLPTLQFRPPVPSGPRWAARAAALLCAALLPAAAVPAAGNTVALPVSAVPLAAVHQAVALARQAAAVLAPAGARIEAVPGALDSRLRLAPCEKVQTFQPAGVSAWGRTRIGLRCTRGPVAWQIYLPLTVQVWAPAVVAAAALPVGARLDTAQLALADVDWAAAPGLPETRPDALVDRVLARPLGAGQALRSTDLRPRQWFAPGETVRLVAQGTGYAVSTDGQALSPGIEGQPVRVRTASGRIVTGRATGERLVELAL